MNPTDVSTTTITTTPAAMMLMLRNIRVNCYHYYTQTSSVCTSPVLADLPVFLILLGSSREIVSGFLLIFLWFFGVWSTSSAEGSPKPSLNVSSNLLKSITWVDYDKYRDYKQLLLLKGVITLLSHHILLLYTCYTVYQVTDVTARTATQPSSIMFQNKNPSKT